MMTQLPSPTHLPAMEGHIPVQRFQMHMLLQNAKLTLIRLVDGASGHFLAVIWSTAFIPACF